MPPSKAEYIAYLEKQKDTTKPSIDMALGLIRTAAVSVEHLTGNEYWDRFLSIAQHKLELVKKEQAEWLLICGNAAPEFNMREAQLKYQFTKGYVEALEEVIRLPHQLMETYKGVKS